MIQDARPGDLVLTRGHFRWWPPKYIVRSVLYREIRRFQKKRYERMRWAFPALGIPRDYDYLPTHVYVVMGSRLLFEFTEPRARFISVEDSGIEDKGYTLHRWRHYGALPTTQELADRCHKEFEGDEYDIGDLLDFELSGWLKILEKVRLFGDRADKLKVCSTGAFSVLAPWGVFAEFAPDPAYIANVKRDFKMVADRRK